MADDDRPIYPMPAEPFDDDGIPTCTACGCQDFEVTHVYGWSGLKKQRRHVCKHCGISYRSTQFWESDDTGIKSA